MSCSCLGTPTIPVVPPCPSNNNCLKMADIIVACKDAVGPCGGEDGTGTLNVITPAEGAPSYCHQTGGCGETPISIQLLSWDATIFASVTLVGNVITWVTKDASTVNKFGTIRLRACCGDLASEFKVIICIKDLCKCTACTTLQTCNPCTGLCVNQTVDLTILDDNQNCEQIDVSVV